MGEDSLSDTFKRLGAFSLFQAGQWSHEHSDTRISLDNPRI